MDLLNVLDCLGGGDIAGVDAEAVAEAGYIIIRAVVHGAVVGSNHIQALQRGVVGFESAQLVIRTDAAEGAPGRRLALDRVERAGLALAEVPGIGAELFVHALVAELIILGDGFGQIGQTEFLRQLFECVRLGYPAFPDAFFEVFGKLVQDAALEVVADEPDAFVRGRALGDGVIVQADGGHGVHIGLVDNAVPRGVQDDLLRAIAHRVVAEQTFIDEALAFLINKQVTVEAELEGIVLIVLVLLGRTGGLGVGSAVFAGAEAEADCPALKGGKAV